MISLGDQCQFADPCTGNPCGVGTCRQADLDTDTSAARNYSCSCPPGYSAPKTGGRCVDVDECSATKSPCANGGVCVNREGDFTCRCPVGRWAGENCQTELRGCNWRNYTDRAAGAVSQKDGPCGAHGECLSASSTDTAAFKCICHAGTRVASAFTAASSPLPTLNHLRGASWRSTSSSLREHVN